MSNGRTFRIVQPDCCTPIRQSQCILPSIYANGCVQYNSLSGRSLCEKGAAGQAGIAWPDLAKSSKAVIGTGREFSQLVNYVNRKCCAKLDVYNYSRSDLTALSQVRRAVSLVWAKGARRGEGEGEREREREWKRECREWERESEGEGGERY
jgi:hypothetical protein